MLLGGVEHVFFIVFPVVIITILVVVKYLEFRRSEYKAESGNSFIAIPAFRELIMGVCFNKIVNRDRISFPVALCFADRSSDSRE
jgi:hypothetical protein